MSSLSYGPHTRIRKADAKIEAGWCRRKERTPDMCAWYWSHGGGCPWLNLNIPCKAVQEGHWTLIFMNCHCRDVRVHNERKAHSA